MAVMKNNLNQHLKWLDESKAYIPTKEALRDITSAVIANVNRLPNRNNTPSNNKLSEIKDVASAPSRQQNDSIQRVNTNSEFSPILSNVEKTTRKTSGLRLARRETSITKSSGSTSSSNTAMTSSTSKHSSPQHQTVPNPGLRQTPAIIDLTFDDEGESTPTVPRRRPNENVQDQITSFKRQRTVDDNDFMSDDEDQYDDDTEFNEELRLHDIRKQNSFTTSNAIVNSTIDNTTAPTPLPVPPVRNVITRKSSNDLLQAQKDYIDICEKRIELLVKRVVINESTALSEDEKKRKRNELSSELVQLEKEQKQSKSILITFDSFVPPPARQLSAPQVSNLSTSNIMSSRVAMEVLESSRNTRETRDRRPLAPLQNIESINSDDLELTVHDIHNHRRYIEDGADDEEMEDVLGDRTNDGLVTSQIQDDQPNQSDLDFIDGELEEDETDGEYNERHEGEEDDEAENESEVESLRVSQGEVNALRNSSDDEAEDGIEGNEEEVDHAREVSRNLMGNAIQSDDEIEVTHQSIRSEDWPSVGDESDDEIEEINFDDERETMRPAATVIQIDSDLDLDEQALPPPRLLNTLAPNHQTPPIINEEDFLDGTFPPSSPLEDRNRCDITPPGENHPWTAEVFAKLKEIFKLSSFRKNQLEAVNNTLAGRDTFVLMPTGGGKSLCYQLPAVVKSGKTHGTTIVVSPLISLMQDQVEHLWEKNIKAGMINSKGSAEEKKTTFNLFIDGFLDLVYLSPEMISASNQAKNAIDRLYRQGKLARVVVDEAHCVSSWGHDFRPDYKHLSYFKQHYPDIPVMALTATANDHVKMDIIHNLNLVEPLFLKQSFNRTNLFYEVVNKDKDHMKQIETSLLSKFRDQTGIIYCHSKNSCEQTSEKLIKSGVKCAFYHAGMTPEDRLDIQKKWQQGIIRVICATIAFGMGIDKADVRFVIHLTLPRTLEGYYQETGRAGRDGNYSYCTMFYSFRDARTLQNMISRDKDLDRNGKEKHLTKLRQVIQYCENSTDCRRQQVLQYFNEEFDKKDCEKNCDNCEKGTDSSTMYNKDVTEIAKQMTELVRSLEDQRVTLIYCQDIFKGSKTNKITSAGHDDLPQHGAGKELDKVEIERIAFHLIAEKILEEFSVFNAAGFASSYIRIGPESSRLLNNKKKIIMTFSTRSKRSSRPNTASNKKNANATNNRALANNSRTLNHEEMEVFRYGNQGQYVGPGGGGAATTSSFTSARVHLERTTSNIGTVNNNSPATPIQLRELQFNNEEERINFAAAFRTLSDARSRALSDSGNRNSSSVATDDVLKEMARVLPQTDVEFRRLKGLTSIQKGYFKYFKSALEKLKSQKVIRSTQRSSTIGGSAADSRSKYFMNPEEQEENRNVVETLRASSQSARSTTEKKTGTNSRSSQSGRSKKRGKNYNKRSNRGGFKQRQTGSGAGSSQRSQKPAPKPSVRPAQSAMPI